MHFTFLIRIRILRNYSSFLVIMLKVNMCIYENDNNRYTSAVKYINHCQMNLSHGRMCVDYSPCVIASGISV